MYAIIETGGKQYKIKKGDYIITEKTKKKENEKIIFKKVILIFYKNKIINKKKIKKFIIKGKIIKNIKNKKIKILKFKRRKHYKKILGHRQKLQKIKICSIKKKLYGT